MENSSIGAACRRGVSRASADEGETLTEMALPACIFCGGASPATTEEHCPPKALFRDKRWPEGYSFDACADCNGGTSNDDLVAAFLAHMEPGADARKLEVGHGLMKAVNRQHPGVLQELFGESALRARNVARRMGLERLPGQTYLDVCHDNGIVNIPAAVHDAIETLAGKVTKAVYFKETGDIFHAEGEILCRWFTNAELAEHGKIAVVEAFGAITGKVNPKVRNRKDLRDQFDYQYSVGEDGDLHLLRVAFGNVFGFVTIFSQTANRLGLIVEDLHKKNGEGFPLHFIQGPRKVCRAPLMQWSLRMRAIRPTWQLAL